ncbi:MAG TPA: hypothetical protein VMJ32_10245 [Pirellulales bacterium]|nr:hypothetical protein [Pirellulales bacterium]
MPEIVSSRDSEPTVQSPTAAVRETRFDPAHAISRGEKPIPQAADAVFAEHRATGSSAESTNVGPSAKSEAAGMDETNWNGSEGIAPQMMQQFRLQAQQLAAHLDIRQRDLDRREAELHARLAQHESTVRNARLWFQERNNELLERQSQIDEREQRLNSQIVQFDEHSEANNASAQAAFRMQREQTESLSAQQDELALRDLELQRRQGELDECALQLTQRQQQCEAREQKLSQREQRLETNEAALARAQVECDDRRRQIEQERAEMMARVEARQTRLIDQHRRAEIELQQQREALDARSEYLARRGSAMDQLRDELLRIHRETLEMRLATQELWAQMSDLAPQASLEQSLARLRTQLAENYRMQSGEAAAQQKEAKELAVKITQQFDRLAEQKRAWQQWAVDEQRQIELQAAGLAARETELQRNEEQLRDEQQRWDSQRHELQSEIRRLQTELRRKESDPLAGF